MKVEVVGDSLVVWMGVIKGFLLSGSGMLWWLFSELGNLGVFRGGCGM